MINFRIIARIFSLLLIAEGLFMLVSAGVSFIYREQAASSFLYSALITAVTGVIVFTPLRNEEKISGSREGYIIVTGLWIILSIFGTLPFLFTGATKSFTDAFFESISGFTTTGATIFADVESLPRGLLFWRSLTQWLGGLGIIFISLSIFPVVKSVNIQIAAIEFSGYQIEKIQPRIKDATLRLFIIYLAMTMAEAVLLTAGGMPLFDSVCHSLSTLSTGGFSTRNGGIASFGSPFIMSVFTVFMFLAGTNLAFVYFAAKGKFRKSAGKNEFIFYTLICIIFSVAAAVVLHYRIGTSALQSLADGAFHIVSVITTTGFYTQDFNLWGDLMILMIFMLMFTGGTAGSTSGGIKIVRLLILTRNNRQEMKRLIHPSAYLPVNLDKRTVPQNTVLNVLVFMILYFFIACLSTFIISAFGYDMTTSFSTTASMLGNIGPSLGVFGPFTTYSALPVAAKWFLTVLMLLGRLELLTVLVFFSRSFYKR